MPRPRSSSAGSPTTAAGAMASGPPGVSSPPLGVGEPRRLSARARRARLVLALAAAVLAIAVLVAVLASGGGHPGLPLPGIGKPARAGDPFAWVANHEADFEQRAVAGSAHVLFT